MRVVGSIVHGTSVAGGVEVNDAAGCGGGKCLIINDVCVNCGNLVDYKFFCFNGNVEYVYGLSDRNLGDSIKLGVYDADFNKLDVDRSDERHQEVALPKPLNYECMVKVAEHLSEGFPHVRVDLYNVNGRIYFGELTFYDGSGYFSYEPDSFDFELGKKFDVREFAN